MKTTEKLQEEKSPYFHHLQSTVFDTLASLAETFFNTLQIFMGGNGHIV